MPTPSVTPCARLAAAFLACALAGPALAQGLWSEMSPPLRASAAAVHDPVRDRWMAYGGQDWARSRTETWLLSPAGNAPWTTLPALGPAPGPTFGGRFFHDPARDRFLYVFGQETQTGAEIWRLDAGPTPAWSPFATLDAGPMKRSHSSIVLDPAGDRLVFFAGSGPHPTLGVVEWNDVWQLSLAGTPAWSPLAPGGPVPPATSRAPAVYDPAGPRMVVRIGEALWALSLAGAPTWSVVPTTDAPPLAGAMLFLDGPRDRFVLFGVRNDLPGRPGELWSVPRTGGAHTLLLSGADLRAHNFAAVFHDASRGLLVTAFDGGGTPLGGRATPGDETWTFALATDGPWTRLGPPRTGPNGRSGGVLLRDPQGPRVIAFGGRDLDAPSGADPAAVPAPIQHDLAADGGWEPYLLAPGSPAPPAGVTPAAVDAARGRLVAVSPSAIWTLDTGSDTWSVAAANAPWTEEERLATVVDSLGDRVLVIGRALDPVFQVEVLAAWAAPLGAASPAWTALQPGGGPLPAPPPGSTLSAVLDAPRHRILLLGHGARVTALELGGAPTWTALADFPVGLTNPVLARDPAADRLLVFAADWQAVAAPQFYAWSLAQSPATAAPVTFEGLPPPVAARWAGAFDVPTRRLVLLGGESGGWFFRVAASDPPAATVALACPPGIAWVPGAEVRGTAHVTVAGSAATAVDWVAVSARAWPGFPRSGGAPLVAGAASFDVEFPVPDSATTGTNVITLTVGPAGEAAADSCAWTLAGPGAGPAPGGATVRIVPSPATAATTLTLALARPAAVRVEVRGLATGRLVLTRDYGALAAGSYALELAPAGRLRPGLYAVRCRLDGQASHDLKLVVLR